MTELKITPDAAKKRMRVEGRVAAGEKVAVTLVGFGEMDKATTRLRVLFMNTLVAVAGGGGSAAWEADGEDLTGVLDLNTVEAEQVTRCCDANCLFILDDVSAGVRQLYATAEHEVMKWIKAPGADVPTSLDGYADILAETREEVEAFKTEIGGRLSSYQAELDAALAEYSEAMNTRAEQFEAEVRSKTTANAVAITAEEAARKAADAEIVKSLGTVSDKVDGKQDTLTADQLKAVNSGIDAGKVRKIEENAAAVSTLASGLAAAATKSELNSVSSTAGGAMDVAVETRERLASKADLVGGKVPAAQLPSFVDDVLEYDSVSAFPATGEAGRIFVAKDTNLTYRWSGTQYVEISPSLALGETATTAYPGDRGKAAADLASETSRRLDGYQAQYDSHLQNKSNPHGVTAAQVGAYTKNEVDATYRTKQDLFVHERRITGKITNDKNLVTTAFTALSSGLSDVVDGTYSETYRCGVGGGVLSFSFIFRLGFSLPSLHDVGYVFEGTAFEDLKVKYDNATGIYSGKLENPGSDVTYTVSFSLSKLLYAGTRLATFAELGEAKGDISTKLAAKADKATTLAGYGITDAATKTELAAKADKATPSASAALLADNAVAAVDGSAGGEVAVSFKAPSGNALRYCELMLTGVASDGAATLVLPAGTYQFADGADSVPKGNSHFCFAEYARGKWLVTRQSTTEKAVEEAGA